MKQRFKRAFDLYAPLFMTGATIGLGWWCFSLLVETLKP